MVNNTNKFVSGVVAAIALTSAFVAPATAQAANTPFDMMDGIQNAEATQAIQEARKVRDQARNQASPYNDLKNKKNNYDSIKTQFAAGKKTENELNNAAQSYEEKLVNIFVDTSNNDLKSARSSYNDASKEYDKLKKKADETKNQSDIDAANIAETKFNEAKTQYSEKLEAVKDGASNDKIYNSLMTTGQALIDAQKTAEQKYEAVVAQEWGNWTKEHRVTDKSQDTEFQKLIPEFQKLVQKEGKAIPADQVAAQKLDPTKLFLKNDHNVRVWFLDEGAGYRNQLAYEATKDDDYQKGMIFNDVSCKSGCQLSNGNNAPLNIGDFVDLGLIEGGTQLNFLLRADGANGANNSNGDIYGADKSLNTDNLEHLMAFAVQAGGRDYLLMGFEDLRNGGDKDYNDVMFIVDFGKDNLTNKYAKSVPEASNMAAILGVTGAGLMLRRRRRNSMNN
ncbi:MAG: DUF4114 domain-containing protein [Nostocales cyanobacterium 94392]|nr:DUF4114 domain-containing protein [Nostocales cyanobacterium 94392]